MKRFLFILVFNSILGIGQNQTDSIKAYSNQFESSFNEMKYDLALISANKLF